MYSKYERWSFNATSCYKYYFFHDGDLQCTWQATNSSVHEKGATIFGLVILTRRTWHATLLQATESNRTTQQHITVLTAPNVTRHLVTPLVTAPRSLFDMWCRFPCPSLGCAAFPKVLGPAPVPGSSSGLRFRALGRERCSGQSGPKWNRTSSWDKLGQVWEAKNWNWIWWFYDILFDSCDHGNAIMKWRHAPGLDCS